MKLIKNTLITLGLIFPAFALAHSGHTEASGFAVGFGHPFVGPDHLLAMIAVGFWAAQQQVRAVVSVPLLFIIVMTVGALLGMVGLTFAGVEQGIVLSVLAGGLVIALGGRVNKGAVLVGVTGFALCHGIAHGAEMPHDVHPAGYIAGFVLSTALLHGFGILMARVCAGRWERTLQRTLGSFFALVGVALAFV